MMWKILTALIREEIKKKPLKCREQFQEEKKVQQGNERDKWATIYASVYSQSRQNEAENIVMSWIHNKNYDMVSQTWIIQCLKIYKISDKIIKFITKTITS